MKLKSRIKDSFPIGILVGSLTLVLFYTLINLLKLGLISYSNNPYLMKPPMVHLLTMALNMILFRLIVINLEKEKIGKGILLVTVLSILVYLFIFYHSGASS